MLDQVPQQVGLHQRQLQDAVADGELEGIKVYGLPAESEAILPGLRAGVPFRVQALRRSRPPMRASRMASSAGLAR